MRLRVAAPWVALVLAAGAAASQTLPYGTPTSAPHAPTAGLAVERTEATLESLEAEVKKLRAELERLRLEESATTQRTIARGRAYTRLARAGLLPVSGGTQGFLEHVSRIERLRTALARDVELERRIVERRTLVARRLSELEARRLPLASEQEALSKARTAVLAERDRELAFQRAFGGSTNHSAVYGAVAAPLDPSAEVGGFAALRGHLPLPLAGRVEARRVSQPGRGVFLAAPAGSNVRAIHRGRVAFADAYGVYGNAVVITHDQGYTTLVALLGEVAVHAGDEVTTGTRIGTAGAGEGGQGVYLELRRGQETLDVAAWLGL